MATSLQDQARDAWERLSQRDRGLLMVMGAAIGAFVLFTASLQASRALAKRESRITAKLKDLREVATLSGGYREAERQRTDLERKLKDHGVKNLLSYLEDVAKKQQVEIGTMNDRGTVAAGSKDSKIQQTSVELQLARVSLDKLTKLLNEVENNPGIVKVTRMDMRPRTDEPVVDATITVSSYTLGG